MTLSYVEKVAKTMHQLLWQNMLRELVTVSLAQTPVLGVFFSLPPVQFLIMIFIEKYFEKPMFTILSRFGVFTSIDWKNEEQYNEYELQAKKLVPLQDKEEWNEADRKLFKDAARSLIRFHLKRV